MSTQRQQVRHLPALRARSVVADDFKATARVTCKDSDSAADLKKALAAGLVNLKKKLAKDDAKLPAGARELLKATRTALDAVKLSTKDGFVEADLVLDAGVAVQFLRAFAESETPPLKVKSPPDPK